MLKLVFDSCGKQIVFQVTFTVRETNFVILNDNFSNFKTNCQCHSKLPDCFYLLQSGTCLDADELKQQN